jgi:hypothetical protein
MPREKGLIGVVAKCDEIKIWMDTSGQHIHKRLKLTADF